MVNRTDILNFFLLGVCFTFFFNRMMLVNLFMMMTIVCMANMFMCIMFNLRAYCFSLWIYMCIIMGCFFGSTVMCFRLCGYVISILHFRIYARFGLHCYILRLLLCRWSYCIYRLRAINILLNFC